jgi:hypothetical protein
MVLLRITSLTKVANKVTRIAFHNLLKCAAQNKAIAAIGEKLGIFGIKRAKATTIIKAINAPNFNSILLFISKSFVN